MRNSNPNVVYRGNLDNGRLIAIKRFNKLASPDNQQFFGEARVALYLAQALDYCSSKGRALYYDLNAYRVLFDQKGMQHKDFPRGCES